MKRALRAAYLVAGCSFLVLAVIGLVLPVLPATPFVLLAAACFARSSQRFYDWLRNHRLFGPAVREWREHRSIPYRIKLTAVVLMSLSLAVSIGFFVEDVYARWALSALGVVLAVWLYSFPSRDRARRHG